ncbi:MAG TPA: ESX secretion-associated protein EspG [Actinophytocola sp.]|uniref:ESX secretion-associated protein EspG n=1 Tax=Actinophytocola sp. TaxID=1872138 RepID=UPI002DB6A7F5|nr:ESX secretion-associated protein EspG [Actinophytocola sp.]HEU5476010.1 ESX secretion-associated protein EspG [Actinophytocola sp.]
MAGPYRVSLAAADILSQSLALNLRLFPFEIPSVGRLKQDRVRIARMVFLDLARRGLVRNGELDPGLRRALDTIADYRVAVAVLGTLEKGKQIMARASANGDTGVLAVQDGQHFRLELIRPTALAATVVGLLPKADAGPGQSVTLTKPALRGDEATSLFGDVSAPRHTVTPSALRVAEGYLTRPRTGAGFFAVSGKDRNGKDVRTGEVGWFDTDAGRYLNLSRPPGEDGQIHGTLSPADNARLTQQLGHLIDSAARPG